MILCPNRASILVGHFGVSCEVEGSRKSTELLAKQNIGKQTKLVGRRRKSQLKASSKMHANSAGIEYH